MTPRTSGITEVPLALAIPVKMMGFVFQTSENLFVFADGGSGANTASSVTLDNQETQDVEGSPPPLGQ